MKVSDEIKKQFNGKLQVKLVTIDGIGSQFVEPYNTTIEDDGSLTIEVQAWRELK